jgi:hypothetical protein
LVGRKVGDAARELISEPALLNSTDITHIVPPTTVRLPRRLLPDRGALTQTAVLTLADRPTVVCGAYSKPGD